MTRWVLGVLCGALVIALAAAPATAQTEAKLQPGTYAHFVTSEGEFTVRLLDQAAPKTVANFVGLAQGSKAWTDPKTGQPVKRPYYNGLIFHRVIDGFMIQGGDPLGTGTGGPGYTFPDEIDKAHKFDKAGIVAMANRGPNTNGGQFFITVAAYPQLPLNYTIFGEVVSGLDIVQKIGKVPTDKTNNRPVTPVVIKSIKIDKVPAA